jgi:His/Glu/Gln/Arg/opine family amino acid ABC transporter permease subunit
VGYLVDPDNWEWLFSGNNVPFVLEGFAVNLQIALIAMALSLAAGLVLALLRLSRMRAVSTAAGLWIDLFRNLPLIFLILYLALGLPTAWRDATATCLRLRRAGVPRSRPLVGPKPDCRACC